MLNKFLALFDLPFIPIFWVVDLINRIFTPFEPFTRPVQPKYPESLETKEAKFYTQLQDFWQGNILNYRSPIQDAGDQCLHHGLYTTMLVLKSILTKDNTDATRAISGLSNFHINGLLVRGIQADGTVTQDVSNDQLSGHLLALYYAWKYIDPVTGSKLIDEIANELLTHNNSLVNLDGSVTTYGKLINGLITDPLSLTLCLAVYRLGYQATGKTEYLNAYNDLYNRYHWRIPYADFGFLWMGQTSVPLRAAIHYHILFNLDPQIVYDKGMRRLGRIEYNSGSPVLTFLCPDMNVEGAMKHLQEYTLEDKQLSVTHVNSDKVETVKWGNTLRVKQPLPRYMVRSEEFFDCRMWWSCDDVGTGELHNGGDFLLGYWGLKFLHLI